MKCQRQLKHKYKSEGWKISKETQAYTCTWANISIVLRKRRARSPSSIAQSIIISLQVRPEAQASTIPENWLSKQQDICRTLTWQAYFQSYQIQRHNKDSSKNISVSTIWPWRRAFLEFLIGSFFDPQESLWRLWQWGKSRIYNCRQQITWKHAHASEFQIFNHISSLFTLLFIFLGTTNMRLHHFEGASNWSKEGDNKTDLTFQARTPLLS